MPQVSFNMSQLSGAYKFRAPTGKLLQITDIHIFVPVSGNNSLTFVPRHLEERNLLDRTESESFYFIRTSSAGEYSHNFNDPGTQPKMKIFSCAVEDNTVFAANIIISYKLIKASVEELVLEFISRGKQP